MSTPKGRVKLNVGGRIFETTVTTLEIAGEDSLFCAMLDKNWNPHSDSDFTEHLIDRNPDCFGVLLDLLRTGELYIPPKRLNIMAFWIMSGRTIHSGLVSKGCLDYNKVNNLCWIDSENIVVSTDGKLGSGCMGLFNASTGELRYKFQVPDKLKGYTSGALGFSPDNKLFSSCTGPGDQHGIGVWDQVTGTRIDFLYGSLYRSQNNASRLQWLHGTKCLMVSSFNLRNSISLFDVRKISVVWSWSSEYYEDDQTKQLCSRLERVSRFHGFEEY
ncbi:hypothetical protein CQW23_27026 [Capsicum baccatum]|uniref:BTB domain-containing protein n=1 Tax=Capsicum baccatum TaxID=33114 RepID=A0A2G2VQI4_CAPBA|nr:hypothetical protein CQW23_27026 [Capsicum baccatum]